ncbi:MAG TPA: DUF4249 domain-containing protein [Agriterribacter sp.]|nr:DUF4249 domain-containing protein [Agriterribacter sp.]
MALRLFFFITVWVACISCEKDIDIDLHDAAPKLVVEATIENDHPPVVILSTSLDYFSEISPEILEASFVHDATITVSDGTTTSTLKEYIVDSNGVNLYFYSVDASDPSSIITGKLNTAYSLKIVANGSEYDATTTIPAITKKIDSLFSQPVYDNPDSTKVQVLVTATDPPGLGDYIRYYTSTNDNTFFPPSNSVFDDLVIDGTTYTLPIQKGLNKNMEWEEDDFFFHKGDSVAMKTCNIDKATFDFCRTYEFALQSTGNPFSNPTKITGNISNGALGYFGGYASQFRQLVIPY